MVTLAKLRRKPKQFRSLTGLSVSEFDKLFTEFESAYEQARQERQNRAGRTRQPGAGRPFVLPLTERLFMALLYFRLYLNQNLLSPLFDIDQSSVSREVMKRVLPVLEGILPLPLRDAPLRHLASDKEPSDETLPAPSRKRKRINNSKS